LLEAFQQRLQRDLQIAGQGAQVAAHIRRAGQTAEVLALQRLDHRHIQPQGLGHIGLGECPLLPRLGQAPAQGVRLGVRLGLDMPGRQMRCPHRFRCRAGGTPRTLHQLRGGIPGG